MSILRIDRLSVAYGSSEVVHDVTLHVEQGEVVALLGANGAGKTTLLRTVSGLVRPRSGTVSFAGRPLGRMAAHAIARLGIAHVPEGRRVFPGLTVREHLLVPAAAWGASQSDLRAETEKIFDLFPRLREKANQLGWSLSGGEQQMLALGRALMLRPRVLLLDEPSLGLAPKVVENLFERIAAINRLGVTVLLVEQNAYLALEIAHRAHVLESGRIVLSGSAADLRANPEVERAYLGG